MESQKGVSMDGLDKVKDCASMWASLYDAILGDLVLKSSAGDRLGVAISSIRLAQLSSCCLQFFRGCTQELVSGETDARACNQAAEKMVELVLSRLEKVFGPGEVSKVTGSPLN